MRGHGPRYRVVFRRRRDGKTNYHLRRRLLLSKKPRFIVRRSNRYITIQIVNPLPDGDQVIVYAHSKELRDKFNWKASCGNIPAAYLTGLLAGYRAQEAGITDVVADIGLVIVSKGAKVFAALKGALDAGLSIPHSEDILPDEARIQGEPIANFAEELAGAEADENKKHFFSLCLKRGLKPQALPEHFEEAKKKVVSSFEGG